MNKDEAEAAYRIGLGFSRFELAMEETTLYGTSGKSEEEIRKYVAERFVGLCAEMESIWPNGGAMFKDMRVLKEVLDKLGVWPNPTEQSSRRTEGKARKTSSPKNGKVQIPFEGWSSKSGS